MITVKTGAYSREDLIALYYALEEAIITLQNHTSCANCATCEVRNACKDLGKTLNYLNDEINTLKK